MTGRYRITLTPPTDRHCAKNVIRRRWSLFTHTCESLAADGLNYAVAFELTGKDPHILITASGQSMRKAKAPRFARIGMVQPVKSAQCAIHAQEVEWFLPENHTRRNSNTTHWRNRRDRHDELTAMAEEQLRAELEYWRELELLSGQRQRFKPGQTDETRYADDEVAA